MSILRPFILTLLLASGLSQNSFAQAEQNEEFKLDSKAIDEAFSFKDNEAKCVTLNSKELKEKSKVLSGLPEFSQHLVDLLNQQNAQELASFFHERLKIQADKISTVFDLMHSNYGKPFQASLFETYLLRLNDGKPDYINCETSHLSILPQYGYNHQALIWLQVMGKNEVGRLLMAAVPTPKGWRIGSFHSWQWTSGEKDYQSWYQIAQEKSKAKDTFGAYLHADVARKLLQARPYMRFADEEPIEAFKTSLFADEAALMQYLKALKVPMQHDIGYFGTTLTGGGINLLFRFKIDKEQSSMAMRQDCEKISDAILKREEFSYLRGVRCAYNMPTEVLNRDGVLGSLYYPRKN